jgi:hypothetical protein
MVDDEAVIQPESPFQGVGLCRTSSYSSLALMYMERFQVSRKIIKNTRQGAKAAHEMIGPQRAIDPTHNGGGAAQVRSVPESGHV